MGLIGKLKEFFNKNIECGEDLEKHIVFPFVKKKYLYLNKNILVRENSACVIVYKNKVCDVLIVGKYKVNAENVSGWLCWFEGYFKKKRRIIFSCRG